MVIVYSGPLALIGVSNVTFASVISPCQLWNVLTARFSWQHFFDGGI